MHKIQTNNTSFQATITIKDCGKCLSSEQKKDLVRIARNIGTEQDKIFLGTRKYKQEVTNKYNKKVVETKKDIILTSIVSGWYKNFGMSDKFVKTYTAMLNSVKDFYQIPKKERTIDFNNIVFTEIYYYLKKLLNTPSFKLCKTAEESEKLMEQELKDFFNLEKINHIESFSDKIKKFFNKFIKNS